MYISLQANYCNYHAHRLFLCDGKLLGDKRKMIDKKMIADLQLGGGAICKALLWKFVY